MRVDEGRNRWNLLAIKMEARAIVGREEKSLPCDPPPDLSWVQGGRRNDVCEDCGRDEQRNKTDIYPGMISIPWFGSTRMAFFTCTVSSITLLPSGNVST